MYVHCSSLNREHLHKKCVLHFKLAYSRPTALRAVRILYTVHYYHYRFWRCCSTDQCWTPLRYTNYDCRSYLFHSLDRRLGLNHDYIW